MLHRLYYVLLTYVTRPMIWVVGGIYVVTLLIITIISLLQSRTINPRSPAYPEISFPPRVSSFQNTLKSETQEVGEFTFDPNVVVLDLSATEFSAKSLQRLQGCRRLRALKINDPLQMSDEESRSLGELRQLEALSLVGCSLDPAIWRHLGQLPKLRYLDLSGCHLWGDYSGLESLSRLETLVLGSPAGVAFVENDAPFLPELKRLPRLTTLVVWSYYSAQVMQNAKNQNGGVLTQSTMPAMNNVLADGLEVFRSITSLRTLYVTAYSYNFPGFEALQRELPGVRVRPAFVDVGRPWSVCNVFVLDVILMLLIGLQLQSQFSYSGARLIPGYTAPHVIPLLLIWLLGVLLNAMPLLVREVPLLATAGLVLLPWGLLCGIYLVGTISQKSPSLMRWLTIPLFVVAAGGVPLMFLLFQSLRSSIDWYFRGYEPSWAGLFIITGVIASGASLWQVLHLQIQYAELGMNSPPLGFDPVGFAAWQQQMSCRQGGVAEWIAIRLSQRLKRAVKRAGQPGWRARCNLWIAGNGGSFNDTFTAVVAIGMEVVGVIWLGVVLVYPEGLDTLQLAGVLGGLQFGTVLIVSAFLPDMGAITAATLWRTRRKFLATESLRPVDRHQFAREVAAAIAWDLLPLGGIYLAMLAWYTSVTLPEKWSIGWTMAMLFYFVARWTVVYGLTLWAVVIRRNWVLALAAFFAVYAAIVANITILFFQFPTFGVKPLPPDMPDVGVLGLVGMIILLGIVGWAVARSAYWRWQRIELA